ncbi:MAG: anthranilate synthase component I family protein [Thermodesulfobacteriota bacterium]
MRLRDFPDKEKFSRLYGRHDVVPVCREILADMETPVSVLKKTYDAAGPAFLLESVEGGERWGTYSFLSTSARALVRLFTDEIEIDEQGRTTRVSHEGDPLGALRKLMNRYNPAIIAELPRFWGGLVGYFTYETVSFFEAIENQLPHDRPVASFMIPDEMMIFDNIRNTMMLVAVVYKTDGASSGQAYEEGLQRLLDMEEKIRAPLPRTARGAKGPLDEGDAGKSVELSPVFDKAEFLQNVEIAKSHIMAGDIIQAVISQPFTAKMPADPIALYRAQRYVNPSPYMFFMHLDNTLLVGSSPETMVRLENRVASLRPIAGTRPRGKTEQEDRKLADDLLADEKERAEHLMLVDLGRNDLGRVAETGTVQVTDLMVVERYSHVMHLVSNITCDLMEEMDAFDLLAASFPAGTLSGAPKVRAMEIIGQLEKQPRGPYGGAVGYISFHGNMDLAITIRTACVENKEMTVRAGAGIVADSDPEKEYVETVNKAMAIGRALELIKGEIS